MFLEISQNSQENTCARVLKPAALLRKETLIQVFFREFCEISKNTFLHRTPQVAASGTKLMRIQIILHFKPHCNFEKISLK